MRVCGQADLQSEFRAVTQRDTVSKKKKIPIYRIGTHDATVTHLIPEKF